MRLSAASASPYSQPAPTIATRGELAAAGYVAKSVKAEIRDNLLVAMAAGEDRFPGIIGFGDTVLPQLERALLAGHDMVLLGERGQYDLRIHHDEVVAPMLRQWKVFERDDLDPAAEKARETLAQFMTELDSQATREEEQRARAEARRLAAQA